MKIIMSTVYHKRSLITSSTNEMMSIIKSLPHSTQIAAVKDFEGDGDANAELLLKIFAETRLITPELSNVCVMYTSRCLKVFNSSRRITCIKSQTCSTHNRPNNEIKHQQTSGTKTEAEMEHLEKNPYYSKYAERFKKLNETSPEQFQAKLNALEIAKQIEKEQREADRSSAAAASVNQATLKGLDAVLKLDLIADKSAEEIAELWKQYHESKDYIFAVIPATEYLEMQRKAKEFTNFIYPVPRNEGYEYFLQRWSGDACHFTSLLAFQTYRDLAPTCLSLVHYTELINDRGIVLMHGRPDMKTVELRGSSAMLYIGGNNRTRTQREIQRTKKEETIYESQLLALQVKMYYGICAGLKFNLVRHFNNAPESFRHEQLIREFENYKKDAQDKKAEMR